MSASPDRHKPDVVSLHEAETERVPSFVGSSAEHDDGSEVTVRFHRVQPRTWFFPSIRRGSRASYLLLSTGTFVLGLLLGLVVVMWASAEDAQPAVVESDRGWDTVEFGPIVTAAGLSAVPVDTRCEADSCEAATLAHLITQLDERARGAAKRVSVLHLSQRPVLEDAFHEGFRGALQARFGAAGQGLVPLTPVEEGGRLVDVEGWSREQMRQDGASDLPVRWTADVPGARLVLDRSPEETLVRILAASPAGSAGGTIRLDDDEVGRIEITGAGPQQVRQVAFSIDGIDEARQRLTIEAGSAGLEVFGVSFERDVPGVVVHHLSAGVLGAHGSFERSEVMRRYFLALRPDLVMLSLPGGASATVATWSPWMELLTLIRQASPNASCLAVGPPDMKWSRSLGNAVHQIRKTDCAFWDANRSLGGGRARERLSSLLLVSEDGQVGFSARRVSGELLVRELGRLAAGP